jgi:hypothetical protein
VLQNEEAGTKQSTSVNIDELQSDAETFEKFASKRSGKHGLSLHPSNLSVLSRLERYARLLCGCHTLKDVDGAAIVPRSNRMTELRVRSHRCDLRRAIPIYVENHPKIFSWLELILSLINHSDGLSIEFDLIVGQSTRTSFVSYVKKPHAVEGQSPTQL